jgi:hypothetical protein
MVVSPPHVEPASNEARLVLAKPRRYVAPFKEDERDDDDREREKPEGVRALDRAGWAETRTRPAVEKREAEASRDPRKVKSPLVRPRKRAEKTHETEGG